MLWYSVTPASVGLKAIQQNERSFTQHILVLCLFGLYFSSVRSTSYDFTYCTILNHLLRGLSCAFLLAPISILYLLLSTMYFVVSSIIMYNILYIYVTYDPTDFYPFGICQGSMICSSPALLSISWHGAHRAIATWNDCHVQCAVRMHKIKQMYRDMTSIGVYPQILGTRNNI